MKKLAKHIFISCFCAVTFFSTQNIQAQEDLKLFYNSPAEKWVEALPIGNGSLGAMVYGGVTQEHIQFNQETLWAGKPHDYAHKGASKYLAEIRQLLADGKQLEAQTLAQKEFMSEPLKQVPYQPFGDLYIAFNGHENFANYQRELDVEEAISKVSYTVNGVDYKREVFSSFPDQVIAVNLTSSKSKALNFKLWLDALHEDKSVKSNGNTQTLEVQVKDGALRGVATLKIKTNGTIVAVNGKLQITDASKATIYLTAATNFIDFNDVTGNPNKIVDEILANVASEKYKKTKKKHIEDYQSLYNRFELDLGDNGKSKTATDKRLLDFSTNPDDPQFVALYVQYARYLMIASSRPGSKPATLQGIWNDKLNPPWFSSYTTNINLEMNYWPVEIANLSECHEPLFDFIEDISKTGKTVAKEQYDADGWIVHHNVDIWRGAAPVNASHHGIWLGGAGWLSSHIWEHYLFTQDKEFLKENYHLMRDAARFYSEFLYEDEKTGYLISSPSNSPEIGGLVAGPTMDHQIIRALFKSIIEASAILKIDEDFSKELAVMIPKIAPNKIGKHGQLQEWLEDKDDPESHHRHVSHLWAVYPGNEINYEETPELMKAAKQSLEYRGDNGTGWSLAWKVNFWSRFKDGDHSYKLLNKLLSPAERPNGKVGGGSYPNLFDAHPPFQIDGNFGGASGILEMILQSHLGKIEILPALPKTLTKGSVSGIVARGGFELSFEWGNSELKTVKVTSKKGQNCKLVYKGKEIEFETEAGKTYTFDRALNKK
ncbi:glycoside hydrolase family 95 protein [Cellulophaga baltica]|uniref:glycoside hydrolase family 95 protein n=1 Tax=Cellulophaga TaxID=104264 RepID=UPI001C06D307|nr:MULTISPECIES: glycoside hydrolase family 95 protein [Cellulophaga]MBU2997988.1 glycoside hydrolase family 95 protein [Cellulophaga baltica]MDO6769389.1 glycoside hydrolase family 95 protein [Cellulophaga sp. 1_MG-2023]